MNLRPAFTYAWDHEGSYSVNEESGEMSPFTSPEKARTWIVKINREYGLGDGGYIVSRGSGELPEPLPSRLRRASHSPSLV